MAVFPAWSPASPDVLDQVGPRWTRIDHVPFGAAVDVEHVLLSTAGVAVLTTPDAVPGAQRPISEARWRARKVGFLLAPVARVDVLAILMVSGCTSVGYGMRDGVLVATPDDAACWLAHLDPGATPLTFEDVGAMVDVLVAHTHRTEQVNARFSALAGG